MFTRVYQRKGMMHSITQWEGFKHIQAIQIPSLSAYIFFNGEGQAHTNYSRVISVSLYVSKSSHKQKGAKHVHTIQIPYLSAYVFLKGKWVKHIHTIHVPSPLAYMFPSHSTSRRGQAHTHCSRPFCVKLCILKSSIKGEE